MKDPMIFYVEQLPHAQLTLAVVSRTPAQLNISAISGDLVTFSIPRKDVSALRRIVRIMNEFDPLSTTFTANLIYK